MANAKESVTRKGNIQVQTDNIFPIIKKFLYSDNEIFLRELVSNATDAIQKTKLLGSIGEFKGSLKTAKVEIKIDKEAKTLTVSDNGIGMTAEEMEKYLNQVAFSGAREFLEKYKGVEDKQTIIGHFGLGFYSAFMVAAKVEVVSKSFQTGEPAHRWSCDGSPSYSIEPASRKSRGTDVILHMSEEGEEFLDESRVRTILTKYGRFLPVPVFFENNQINNTEPAWTKKPLDLTQEDYSAFYKELYPGSFEDPLFQIHLNVDYPFNLTGILYFPKIKEHFDVQRKKISLFSNQVFITDSVEGVVPEFLTLLHGVLDSPDIPLNVSRSYLQSDANVRKISSHVTKKVADKLEEMFQQNREDFEAKWNDIRIFVQYGAITDVKFAERAKKFVLFENLEGRFYTLEELKEHLKDGHTDKNNQLVVLYSADPEADHGYISRATERGYQVFKMNSPLEAHYLGHLEQTHEGIKFARIDSDSPEKLIDKGIEVPCKLTDEQRATLVGIFESLKEDSTLSIAVENLSDSDMPVTVTESEFIRRMNEMQQMNAMGGQAFRMQSAVVNANHPIMVSILEKEDEQQRKNIARQILDMALLTKGMLKGEALTKFLQRSLELLK